jgi:hypothetical protein
MGTAQLCPVLNPSSVTVAIMKVQCGRLGTCSSPRLHKPSHLFPKLKKMQLDLLSHSFLNRIAS